MPSLSLAASSVVLTLTVLPLTTPFDDDAIAPDTFALFDYDAERPLDIQEVGSEPFDGYDIIDLTYASPMGGRVPAYLYMPHDEGPKAGMLLMHGMPGDRSNGAPLARQYVEAGAVVLAISAPWARSASPVPISFTPQDRANQIQLIQDLRRGVDLLLTFPWVDKERLGYVGISYGGAMGGLLAGVEHRIKAYVLGVGDGGLLAHMTSPGDVVPPAGVSEEQWNRWVSDMDPIEPVRFVAHAAPSELLPERTQGRTRSGGGRGGVPGRGQRAEDRAVVSRWARHDGRALGRAGALALRADRHRSQTVPIARRAFGRRLLSPDARPAGENRVLLPKRRVLAAARGMTPSKS